MAEEPQIDERNGERETLLAALEAADTPPSEETPKSEELASDASESEETADTTPAETEPEVKAEEEVTGETSEPSNREKKSQERMELSWNKTNAAKAELKKEREEFEAQKQQHSDDQTSPKEYRDLAEQYKEDGEAELAELAEQKAEEVEQRRQSNKDSEVAESIKGEWVENLKDLQEQHPSLKDAESSMSRGVENVLEQRPYLKGYPEGIQDAVEFVKSKIAAKQAESLEKTNGDLKAEIEELRQQTSVTGSPPGREAAPKGPSEGSQEQIKGKLLDALQQADDSGAGLRIFR
tara:strand:+ start:8753 stop:9634 length:882 start_codon:yes stop_codon:yes gene_type:complete